MEIQITTDSRFDKEWKKFCNKYKGEKALDELKRLLKKQFGNSLPDVIGPKSIWRTPHTGDIDMWKVICAIKGLKKNQSPKIYFLKHHKNIITFLCFGSHIQNYKNGKLREIAIVRAKEIINFYKSR